MDSITNTTTSPYRTVEGIITATVVKATKARGDREAVLIKFREERAGEAVDGISGMDSETTASVKYWYFWNKTAPAVDTEVKIDLAKFVVKRSTYTPVDEDGNDVVDKNTGQILEITRDTLEPRRNHPSGL